MALEHVERRAVAEEVGFVVEQRLDDLLRQARLLAHDEDGDELVQRADAALAHQRRQRGLDPPAAAQRQLLAGTRFEQAGEMRLELSLICTRPLLGARSDTARDLVGRKHCAGQASVEHGPRHAPDGAAGLVLGDDRAAAGDHARGAFDAVTAHAGKHDAERAGAVHRADGGEHWVDRRHAATARAAVGQADDRRLWPGSSVK